MLNFIGLVKLQMDQAIQQNSRKLSNGNKECTMNEINKYVKTKQMVKLKGDFNQTV